MTSFSVVASRVGLLVALLPPAACEATVGVRNLSIPRDAAHTCAMHCQSIGLQVTAVAIMAENVGCICQFVPAPAAPPTSPSPPAALPAPPPATSEDSAGVLGTPAAGMATIGVQQAAAAALLAQQQEQRHQQQRRK